MTDTSSPTRPRRRSHDRRASALFGLGLAIAAGNAALYFFGVESLSHPAVSVVAVALLLPLYLERT